MCLETTPLLVPHSSSFNLFSLGIKYQGAMCMEEDQPLSFSTKLEHGPTSENSIFDHLKFAIFVKVDKQFDQSFTCMASNSYQVSI